VPATVTISGTTAQTATLTVNTTAATAMNQRLRTPWRVAGGAVLACVALLIVPLRRRRWMALMAWVALFAATAGMGCGGGGSAGGGGGGGGGGQKDSGTTAGIYTVTITGVSGGMTETGTVALTVQ
jgi:hypothetical protein